MRVQSSADADLRGQPAIAVLAALMAWAWMLSPMPVIASATRVDRLIQTALNLEPDSRHGAAVYKQQCEHCHERGAVGNASNVIPALAGQREAYLVKQLADFTELERDSPEMHAVVAKAALSEPQVWADIARYLSSLPLSKSAESGDGAGVNLGEAIFREQCASCHASDAGGDDDGFVPSLRNQHYSYLLRQMRGLASLHRHNVDDDLTRFLDSLEVEEMTSVADYLSRLRGPVRDRARLRDDGILRK